MPEAATTEFWKDLKPIENVFKPDALPEVFYAGRDQRRPCATTCR